jgi:hypothetical protein
MSEEREYRCVGGPLDGQTIRTTANKLLFSGEPGMAYHLTRPTDTDWREQYDEDRWITGAPAPPPPDYVMEWHEDTWLSPEVAAIRAAVRGVADRD